MSECPHCGASAAHLAKTTAKEVTLGYRCLRCGHSFEPVNPFVLREPILISDDFMPSILNWKAFYKGDFE